MHVSYANCQECEREVEVVICVGRMEPYAPGTTYLCEECLEKALEMLRKHIGKGV